jgi:hypothetical protein
MWSKFFKWLRALPRMVLLTLAMLLMVLCSASSAFAQLRVFVDEDSTAVTPTGTNWTTAFRHLSEGIAEAEELSEDGDVPVQVWVAEGTYRPDESEANPTGTNPPNAAARAMSFQMHNNVAIYAGFDTQETGTQPEQFMQRRPYENICILSGDLANDDDPQDPFDPDLIDENSHHILRAIRVDGTAISRP